MKRTSIYLLAFIAFSGLYQNCGDSGGSNSPIDTRIKISGNSMLGPVSGTTMSALMKKYCDAGYTNIVQWGVVAYSAAGAVQSSTCVPSGCNYHSCP